MTTEQRKKVTEEDKERVGRGRGRGIGGGEE